MAGSSAAMAEAMPVVLSRTNRWSRYTGSPEELERLRRLDRVDSSVLAIQVLLPELPGNEIRSVLELHGGDPDAALQALLGEEPEQLKEEPAWQKESDEDAAAMSAALAVAAAAEEEEARALAAQKAASRSAVQEQGPAEKPLEKPEKKPATPWLPMLQKQPEQGSTGYGYGRQQAYHDKQTARLKAALGPVQANKVNVPSSHDLDVKGKGGRGGKGGG
eukprot:TRINITY_DN68800_c0_g1_i1.p1 TRINITY_DN68800_c0_g1~~TRINITY_DN68800_c0_g1_i1.p1  ORF type:complete len:219 (-),score=78.02 TRINITY_DN68800_c0_g1_i1:72-728(-)